MLIYNSKSFVSPHAREYFAKINAAGGDVTDKKGITDFINGIFEIGGSSLWNSMVCWPLRSSQNVGTGTTAYSLGGLGSYPGTLVNGPTWGTDGVFCDGTNDYIDTNYIPVTTGLNSVITIHKPTIDEAKMVFGCRASSTLGGFESVRRGVTAGNRKGEAYARGSSGSTASIIVSPAESLAAFHSYFYAFDSSAIKIGFGFDSGAITYGSAGSTAFGSTDNSIKLSSNGSVGNGGGSTGDFAFFANFSGVIFTSAQYAAFSSLYKSTIGTGLGLN